MPSAGFEEGPATGRLNGSSHFEIDVQVPRALALAIAVAGVDGDRNGRRAIKYIRQREARQAARLRRIIQPDREHRRRSLSDADGNPYPSDRGVADQRS